MSKLAYDIGIALLAGVVSGCISSILVILCMSKIKPKLKISKYIARSVYEGKTFYDFKLVNYSSHRGVINIKSELVSIQKNESGKGPAQFVKKIEMHNGDIFNLDKLNEQDNNAGYAGRVSTKNNLDETLATGGIQLRLSVTATDAFSGVTEVFEQYFPDSSSIKSGLHDLGKSMDVSPQPS